MGPDIVKNILKSVVFYRNDLEVTDDFIQEFNDATDPSHRERLQCQSQKMLERIKVVTFMHL